MTKIHLCCGSVYLKNRINIDVDGENAILYVNKHGHNPNLTTEDKYFIRPFESDYTKRKRYPTILDKKMNLLDDWDFEDNRVEEILMVSGIEHFTRSEANHIVSEAYRVLKNGGIFKFDFPDIKKIVEQYYDKDTEEMAELIYCNWKNIWSAHKWTFTPKTIKKLLTQNGKWDIMFKDIVKHDYPMCGVIAEAIK